MVDIPFPKSLPFSVCAPSLDETYCVSAEDLVIGGRRDCHSGRTPPLASFSMTYAEKSYTWHGLETTASITFWAGIEQGLSAIWVGTKQGNCARIPIDPPNPSAAISDIVDDLQEYKNDVLWDVHDIGGPHPHSTGGEVLGALILIAIAIAIFVLPPQGIPG